MEKSPMQNAASSGLLRLAKNMHMFEQSGRLEETAGSPLQVWALGPLKKTVGSVGRFVLTAIAVLFRPKILYTTSTTNHLMGHRAFIVGMIVFYELSGRQFVFLEAFESIVNTTTKKIAETAADILGLLILVGIASLAFWVGARVVKVPLRFQQSTKIACYFMGAVPIFQVFVLLMPNVLVPVYPVFIMALVIILMYVTCFIPVSILNPDISRIRISFGILVGWLVGFLLLLGLFFTTDYVLPGQSFQLGF